MSIFLILMIAGLFGLTLMAIPGLSRHGHGGLTGHGHTVGHLTQGHTTGGHTTTGHATSGPIAHHSVGQSAGKAGALKSQEGGVNLFVRLAQPRVIFGLMALYGTFGYALIQTKLLTTGLAALAAILPTLLVERFAVTPLWNALLGFQGKPCSPLENLIMTDAVAVTPFRNGKGIVSVVRDGRAVQMTAQLPESQATIPVRVGDTLQIENIDPAHERVMVSLH